MLLMAGDSSPDYKALFLLKEICGHRPKTNRNKPKTDRNKPKTDRNKPKTDRNKPKTDRNKLSNRRTTFDEFIRACHNLLSLPVGVEDPTRSTKGSLKMPTGKYCPTRLRLWADCAETQQQLYNSVRNFLHTSSEDAPRLFSPVIELEGIGRRFSHRLLSSEKDVESYERIAVEDHVHDVIAELCKIPKAQNEFALGDGVQFANHDNALDDIYSATPDVEDPSSVRRPKPDQYCIHRVNNNTNALLTAAEYKPPHKLSVENLRAGLRPMDFWEEVVKRENIPTDKNDTYWAEVQTGSVLAQQYHVMLHESLEYSYITNSLALVLLHVRYDDPSTLYYYLCEPNTEVDLADDQILEAPRTAIARVLCLCLMSFLSPVRDHEWRADATRDVHIWKTNFEQERAQMLADELGETPQISESQVSECVPSSPSESPTTDDRRPNTRSQTDCSPVETMHRSKSDDESEPDPNKTISGVKRSLNQITPSPQPTPRWSRIGSQNDRRGSGQHHTTKFCTQRCLLGLQHGGTLDSDCPNVELHRHGRDDDRHLISTERLVQLIKQQLDENIDHDCTPFGVCGAYGAPFKVTCVAYGYTVVGKGTTSRLWSEVSREADVYRVLKKAQGSAVPVFLGTIDLEKIYFLHGGGQIRHMLLMAYGGETTSKLEHSQALFHEIRRSRRDIGALGVEHGDLRFDNVLWNEELGRALIIDFHRSKLAPLLMEKRKTQVSGAKRPLMEKPN
ncbi:hypothetical protein V1509DRAFT_624596 [Lipomyces kononenkoae]